METTNLFIALLFFGAGCFYCGYEIVKIRRRGVMAVNQPADSRIRFLNFLRKPLWFFGLFPNERCDITSAQRPFLYRFLYVWLHVMLFCFCVAFFMVLVQLF